MTGQIVAKNEEGSTFYFDVKEIEKNDSCWD
jgi:hypothetical protein